MKSGAGVHAEVDANYRPIRNSANDYLIDRELQRTTTFTGIRGIGEQDMVVQESMGAITDWTLENLGHSDSAIAQFRRLLLKLVRDFQEGEEPYAAHHGDAYRVRGAVAVLDRNVDFEVGAKERLAARA